MSKLLYPVVLGLLVPLVEGKPESKPAAKPASDKQEEMLEVDTAQDTLDIAKQLYNQAASAEPAARRRQLERALELFLDVTKKHPGSPQFGEAMYMRAVCLSDLGRESEAEAILVDLSLGAYGEFAAAAAFRVGGLRGKKGQWASAESSYALAAKKTQRTELRHDAMYRVAQAQLKQNKKKEAESVFRQLMATDGVSADLYKASVFALANLCTEKNDDADAYSLFLLLIKRNDLDDVQRGTATLQAARLASRLGRAAEAEKHYEELASLPGMERYAGEAQMESLLSLYKQKRYEGVIKIVTDNLADLPDKEMEARRALIVGQSYMALRQYSPAESWFTVAEESCPKTTVAADASYRRLVCAHHSRSAHFQRMAKKHIETYAANKATASMPCNDLVRLMYADRLMASASSKAQKKDEKGSRMDLEEAVRVFGAIKYSNLPASVRPEAEFKHIWCAERMCAEGDISRCAEIVKLLDNFINTYQENEKLKARVPDAFALRGSVFFKQGKYAQAVRDFDKVIMQFPNSPAAPVCMQRAAQAIAKDANGDKNRMVEYYEKLVGCGADRVKPPALAEAHYSIARAKFEQDPISAVDHFRKAKELDADRYGNYADMGIVQCYFKKKDAQHLLEALQEMERRNAALYAQQSPVILRWCGWVCFQGRDYVLADKYLGDSIAFETKKESYKTADGTTKQRPVTEPLVWKSLARARLEIGKYAEGLEAADNYLSKETQPYRQAEGMRDKALLLVGVGRTEEARALCEAAIELGIDGPIKSSLFMALGDAWYADGQYAEAAKYYGRTANFGTDKDLRPAALYKIAAALRKIDRVSEASQYEESLRTEYPNWNPSDNIRRLLEASPR